MQQNKKKPTPLKLAVQAAGGRSVASERFGISDWTIWRNIKNNKWPAHLVKPLCELGDNRVTTDELLEFLTAAAIERGELPAEAEVEHGG